MFTADTLSESEFAAMTADDSAALNPSILSVGNSDAYSLGLCAIASAQRGVHWQYLIRCTTGSETGTKRKHHGTRNSFACDAESEHAEHFRDMHAAGFMIEVTDTDTNPEAQQTYHATPAGCRWAGLHPAAVTRATGAQPLPITGRKIDVRV
tara:strand:+ start:2265 stop:2720 length:456 start_codon:yes stop_codon:yes gene_type:complete